MTGDDARSHNSPRQDRDRSRSRSPFKAIAYEEATSGLPPRRVFSPDNADSVSSSPAPSIRKSQLSTPVLGSLPASRRPGSSQSPRATDRTSILSSDEVKRDSGFATSISTGSRPSTHTEGRASLTASGTIRESTLPTITVQDEGSLPSPVEHCPPALAASSSSQETLPHMAESTSLPQTPRSDDFQGIQADISSKPLDGVDLEDLATDRVGFSKRGSLLVGGKKMPKFADGQRAIGGQRAEAAASTVSLPTPRQIREAVAEEASTSSSSLQAARRRAETQSKQMEAPRERALSADEDSFSYRVRSMYEHGDERAPEWISGAAKRQSIRPGTNGSVAAVNPRDSDTHSLIVEKQRARGAVRPPASPRLSFYSKQSTELAGGIEDWEDVDGNDVDRYGFINPNRAFSRDSEASSAGRGDGLHRVATSLRAEADHPRRQRRLARRISNARTSRSVPPRPGSRVSVASRAPGSIRSARSTATTSRSSVFRSREKRLLGEASDMLTLPPGLADIAEHDDAGRAASLLKQRECSREEKWRKMARPVSDRKAGLNTSVGGGMQFDFDTHDARLIRRTWKGIPDRWRATAWHSFLSTSARKRQSAASDAELIGQFHKLQEMSCADDVQIDVDVPRTISKHIMFRRRYRGGQRLLFRVLHAVSLYFPGTGYVQGMASLAATLLCYFDEERAFVMLVRLWQLRGLEQLFQPGFDGLMTALQDFEKHWLAGGDVAQKLDELGVASTSYGTRWYLTLFSMSVPFPAQLRIWDVFMLLGDLPSSSSTGSAGQGQFGGADLDVLHATSAAIVDATREIILDSDFENAMKVLTSFIPIKDEDLLMRVARTEWKIKKGKKP